MASNVKVVSTDLRQATIKVTPGTYLTDVLEQACKRFSLSPDKYLLKHKQKHLDLSNTFRNAGLVPGARLELVAKSKSPSVISIALELPESEAKLYGSRRATAKLPSDYTLWKVLRHFESETCKGSGINLTARGIPKVNNGGAGVGAGQLYYETPSLQVEQRSMSTFVDFQKTLGQLGYNGGSVLIRVSFQKTDKTLGDAMSDISQYFKDEEEMAQEQQKRKDEELATATTSMETNATPSVPSSAEENIPPAAEPTVTGTASTSTTQLPDPMELDSTPTDPLAPVGIFSAPKNSVPLAAQTTESDEIYVPGIAHAQLHQQRLKNEGQNKRLLSDRELEEKAAAEAAKLAAISAIEVKVRFPKNDSAKWKVGADWTGSTLYRAVRGVMAQEDAPFRLILPGLKATTIADNDGTTLIRGHGLTHDTLISFAWDDSVSKKIRDAPFLKDGMARRATDVVVPEIPQGEDDDDAEEAASASVSAKQQSLARGDGEGKKKGGVPKWLKLGKK